MSSEPSRPTRAKPEAMPIDACRGMPSRSESPGRSSWSLAAAATAAAAWSARFIGTLNKAITASPMYLSIKAPWLVSVLEARRRNSSTTEYVVVAPRPPVISVKDERSAKTTVISTRRPSSRWAPHCVQQLRLRGLRRIPRHFKITAVKPTRGMPQTAQLAANGGGWVSKGALIATQHLERRNRVDDFICAHNRTGIVWDIDVDSGVHLFLRVICRRIFTIVTS